MPAPTSWRRRDLILPALAMTAVVAASNVAVQYPVRLFGLQDFLTWGALTYPAAFFITDLTNRRFGPAVARRVVAVGFLLAVVLSVALATPRIALASGSAFLAGQLLDITVFNRLRRRAWWRAPLASSLIGSALDTAMFFTIAFAGVAAMSSPAHYALASAAVTVPLWVGLAVFDYTVKMSFALASMLPYGALLGVVRPMEARARASGT
jgi:uncharacterized PurR-regulated membrane protein YhhQ (DUF165 family)